MHGRHWWGRCSCFITSKVAEGNPSTLTKNMPHEIRASDHTPHDPKSHKLVDVLTEDLFTENKIISLPLL